MKPSLSAGRWRKVLPVYLFEDCFRPMQSRFVIGRERFGIELFYLGKASKLAFHTIPIAMVVFVLGGELASG